MPPVIDPTKAAWTPSQIETSATRAPALRMVLWGLGLAVVSAGLLAAAHRLTADDASGRTSARSSAYDFGYASAAMTACAGISPHLQDVLAAEVPRDPSGRIADDITEGFKAFGHTLDAVGAAGACTTAGRVIQARQ